ncbi:MAG: hypothetical protein R2827_05580 [Bdellovibrionales bacterium]
MRFCLSTSLALAVSSMFFSSSWAQSIDCGPIARSIQSQSEIHHVLNCLEAYAMETLKPGGIGFEEMQFFTNDIYDKHGARLKTDGTYGRGLQEQQVVGFNMEDFYRISFPTEMIPEDGRMIRGQCFNLEERPALRTSRRLLRSNARNRSFGEKVEVFADKMMLQLDEVGKFIGRFHAMTLMGDSSLLFHPRNFKFCDQDVFYYKANHDITRRMVFFDKTIHLGIPNLSSPDSIEIISDEELVELWNQGDHLRYAPYFPETYNYKVTGWSFDDNKARAFGSELQQRLYGYNRDNENDKLAREMLVKVWGYINPIGSARTTARYILTGLIHKSFQARPEVEVDVEVQLFMARNQFDSLIESFEKAFTQGNIEFYADQIAPYPDRLLQFFQAFSDYSKNSSHISQSIESSIAGTAMADNGMIIQMQDQLCGVGVTNNHTIITLVDFLAQGSDSSIANFIPEVFEQATLEVERDEKWFHTDSRVRIEADGKLLKDLQINMASQAGIVCTNTSDKVKTQIKVPSIDEESYKAYSMNNLLNSIRTDATILADYLD